MQSEAQINIYQAVQINENLVYFCVSTSFLYQKGYLKILKILLVKDMMDLLIDKTDGENLIKGEHYW